MFFKLAYQNAKRSRRENLIYFFTLVVAAASFYIILSLDKQDVIVFLKTFESNAIDRLFALMPIIYVIALVLVAFLALFANRYQLDRRGREFGLYLMLGMSRKRLFLLLAAEGLLTSLFALIGGLLAGGILAELISLITSRIVGQGIIGHSLSFSLEAAGFTVLGFLLAQAVVLLVLARRVFGRELYQLFYGRVEQKQAQGSPGGNIASLLAGLVLLLVAYWLALDFFKMLAGLPLLLATLLLTIGTPLLIRGGARLLSRRASSARGLQTKGLRTFTLRQFQENLVNRSTSVAAASILTMFALMFIAAGAAVLITQGSSKGSSVYHFTVQGDAEQIEQVLGSEAMRPYVADLNRMEMGHLPSEQLPDDTYSSFRLDWSGFREKVVETLPDGVTPPVGDSSQGYSMSADDPAALRLLTRMDADMESPYLISHSSYDRLLRAAGENPLEMAADEFTLYLNPAFFPLDDPRMTSALASLAQSAGADESAALPFPGHPVRFVAVPAMYDLVTDRSVTIAFALIVPDALFEELTDPSDRNLYYNFRIPAELEKAQGMMLPISEASELLAGSGLQYESYLQNFGRQLFYAVAGSYTLLYTGFVFLIIGCTVLALQFLTQLRQTRRRYLTLSMLGAEHRQMTHSLRQQIAGQFLLPLVLACISGTVGLIAMTSFFSVHLEDASAILPLALAFVCLIILVEVLYAGAVARTAEHELDKL